jgi:AcrR family transcriptional regulator
MPRRYSMEVRQEESDRRRERLLDAGAAVLAESGADGLTMEAVAVRADTATRTLYNHFSSRDDLIKAVFRRQLVDLRANLVSVQPEGGSTVERLGSFISTLFEYYRREGASLTALLDHRVPKEVGDQVTEMRTWRRSQLQGILRPARSELTMSLANATAIAFVLTNRTSYTALADESGLSTTRAAALTLTALERAVFCS